MSGTDGLRHRQNGKVVAPSEEGKKVDEKLDQHIEFVFSLLSDISRLHSGSSGSNLEDHGVWWLL